MAKGRTADTREPAGPGRDPHAPHEHGGHPAGREGGRRPVARAGRVRGDRQRVHYLRGSDFKSTFDGVPEETYK